MLDNLKRAFQRGGRQTPGAYVTCEPPQDLAELQPWGSADLSGVVVGGPSLPQQGRLQMIKVLDAATVTATALARALSRAVDDEGLRRSARHWQSARAADAGRLPWVRCSPACSLLVKARRRCFMGDR